MKKTLMLSLITMFVVFTMTSIAFAQTCQEIHNLGTNGCAPSDLDGTVVTVGGVVYVEPGTYNGGSVYWQCTGGTGGLTLYDSGLLGVVHVGDEISVTGTVGAYGSEIQLNSTAVTVLSNGNTPTALAIATGDLAAGNDMLGDFMEVQGVLALVSSGYNSIYTVDDGSGPVTVFVDGTTGIDTTSRMDNFVGDIVLIRGATKCYNGEGELLPRSNDDVILVTIPNESMGWGALKAQY